MMLDIDNDLSSAAEVSRLDSFLRSASRNRTSSSSLFLRLSNNFAFVPKDLLTPLLEKAISSTPSGDLVEAVLVPISNGVEELSSPAVMPLQGPTKEGLSLISKGCPWEYASRYLSIALLEKLFINGMVSATVDDRHLTGPIIPILMRYLDSGLLEADGALATDCLSMKAVSHAARFVDTDSGGLSRRLYCFNHDSVVDPHFLRGVHQEAMDFLSQHARDEYGEVAPSDPNPSWRFFERLHTTKANRYGAVEHKLYISPSVEDTVACLKRLVDLLPKTPATAWKIGKSPLGIARADKICLYFQSLEEAQHSAHLLASNLVGIQAQGVPFTHRYDPHGLVSQGFDPPAPPADGSISRWSWRLWVSQKISRAVCLAHSQPNYPLSLSQAALWSLRFLGVEPQQWRVRNIDFWSN